MSKLIDILTGQFIDLIQNPTAWPGIAVLLIWAAVEWWPRGRVGSCRITLCGKDDISHRIARWKPAGENGPEPVHLRPEPTPAPPKGDTAVVLPKVALGRIENAIITSLDMDRSGGLIRTSGTFVVDGPLDVDKVMGLLP